MGTFIHRQNGNVIMFDTAETVVKDVSNQTTEHPVETGAPITDHVISIPLKVTITGFFSDAAFRADIKDTFDLGPGRATAILQALTAMRDNREIFILEARNEIFENMVLTTFSIPRDKETGDSSRVNIVCQQIIRVERRFIVIPPAAKDTDKTAEEQQTGAQNATPRDKSALVQLFDAINRSKEEIGKP